jgi:hypothetical protein
VCSLLIGIFAVWCCCWKIRCRDPRLKSACIYFLSSMQLVYSKYGACTMYEHCPKCRNPGQNKKALVLQITSSVHSLAMCEEANLIIPIPPVSNSYNILVHVFCLIKVRKLSKEIYVTYVSKLCWTCKSVMSSVHTNTLFHREVLF